MDKNTFERCNKYYTSNQADHLMNIIKGEIFEKLPTLDEKEQYQRIKYQKKFNNYISPLSPQNSMSIAFNDSMSVSTTKTDPKKGVKSFYSTLRKTYSNFLEFNYLDDDLLNELYNYYYTWEGRKQILIDNTFNLSEFIYKAIETISPEAIPSLLVDAFHERNSTALDENENSFWLNANFDPRANSVLNELIKYYKELDNTDSILITLEIDYAKLIDDLYATLINKPKTKRIVLQIKKKSFWIADNVYPMAFFDENEWNIEMNSIVNIILSSAIRFSHFESLCIVCEEKCGFILSKANCELFEKMCNKHKNNLEIIVMKRVKLQEEGQEAFYNGLKSIESVKFVFLKSTKINKEILSRSNELQKNINKYVYFQLSKHCLICNNINK